MNRLPDPQQPTTQAGQPHIDAQVQQFRAAIDDATRIPTCYRDPSEVPAIGTAPPVPQPGPPPMSQWAIDASGVLKGVGAVSIPIGIAVWVVGQVDPLALGIIFGSPAVAALAVARLVAKVKDANQNAPQPVTNHFHGTVHHDERTVTSTNRGIIANTRNQLPR
ncbi:MULTISPECIES: hypothetical protein [unclassified Streptomyces]|uniref:hypothetical protein n=1 Tax=unclassified Streptomyces TaxID=2593676 RepID=UPI0004CC2EA6|nr:MULTISPECIES: hypothetical protein [unclassified Streptomyces]